MGDALIGRVLGGAYRVDRRLGEGGMGAVYLARHVRTGREHAVKVLLPDLASREASLARFRREAHALAALGHANIVAILDFDRTEDGLAYLVMDRLEGEDLAARLRRGPLSTAQAVAIADGIASALEAAHAIGLVHRDLKPGNVFLARIAGAGERPVLLDFGLAKSLEVDPSSQITSQGVVLGTPHYMAPEQAQGAAVDARTDLYALGAILYEMVVGRPPFDAPTIASLFVKILTAPPPSLRAHGITSDALDGVVQRCLAKDPAERFESAGALRRALAGLVDLGSGIVPATIGSSPITRASPPMGAPTPLGNPFGATGDGAASRRAESRGAERGSSAIAIAAIAIAVLTLAAVAVAGTAIAIVIATRPAEPPQIAAPAPIDAGIDASIPDAGIDAWIEPDAPPPAVAVAERPRPRPRPSPSIPIPPGVDRTVPGFDQGLAARERLSAGDWPGCVRALEGAPATLDLLWLRASCAHHAHDRATLERACETLVRRFPESGQARACPALLTSLGG